MNDELIRDTLESLKESNAHLHEENMLMRQEISRLANQSEAARAKSREKHEKRKKVKFVKVFPEACYELIGQLKSSEMALLFSMIIMVDYKTNRVIKDGVLISTSDLARIVGKDRKQITKNLRSLEGKGIILKQQGIKGGKTSFIINKKYCFMGEGSQKDQCDVVV